MEREGREFLYLTRKSYAFEAGGFDVVEGFLFDRWVVPLSFATDCV